MLEQLITRFEKDKFDPYMSYHIPRQTPNKSKI